jgi:hypothetical protein
MERKLAAIFSTDVKGYSRLMGEDEVATVRTVTAYRALMATLIQQHRGRVVDSPGDNLLAEFPSVVEAVECAVATQRELRVRNAALPLSRRMEFRIGINLGDVIVEGERIYGDGVNIAARLEGLAEAGGLCVSGTVYDQVLRGSGCWLARTGPQEAMMALRAACSVLMGALWGAWAALRVPGQDASCRGKQDWVGVEGGAPMQRTSSGRSPPAARQRRGTTQAGDSAFAGPRSPAPRA